MRKLFLLIPIIALSVSFFVVAFCVQADFEGFSGVMAQQNDGTIYLSKQEKGKNTIIQMDKEGRLMMQYSFQKKNGEKNSYIKQIYIDEKEQVYFLKESKDISTGNIVQTDILRLKSKFTPFPSFTLVYRENAAKSNEILDFTVEKDMLFCTSIEGGGKILKTRGFKLPTDDNAVTADTDVTSEIKKNAPSGDGYSDAAYMGGKVYALLKSGNLAAYSMAGREDVVTTELPKAHSLIKGKNVVSALCADKEIIMVKGSAYPTVTDLSAVLQAAENKKFLYGTQSEMCKIYTAQNENGDVQLNCIYAERLYPINELKVSAMKVLQNLWMQVMIILICASAIATVYYMKQRSNPKPRTQGVPTRKLVLIITLAAVILGSVFVCMVTISYKQDLVSQQRLLANTIHGQITNSLLSIDTTNISSATFVQSDEGEKLAEVLKMANEVQSTYKTRNKILTYVGGEFFNLMGDENVVLTPIVSKYSKEYVKILTRAIETTEATQSVYMSEEDVYLLTISPINGKFNTVSGVLITEMSMGRIEQITSEFLARAGILLFVFLLSVAASTFVLANRILSPILKIPKILLDTVQGREEENEIKIFEKTYGSIYRALNEVRRVWAQRIHEQNNITGSYYRFVPRNIQQLLMKKSITDVNFGDSNNVQGIVVTVTISNREVLKRQATNEDFIVFINRCFELINSNMERYNGVLLSGEFNISRVRMLFENYKDAIDFTIAIQDEGVNCKNEGRQIPEIFAIIHANQFFYGIAGSETRVFPFMVSHDVDFISGLRKSFASAGNKIIVAEEVHQNIEQGYSTRYIGYVNDKITSKNFKLYEILNAYNARDKVIYEMNIQKMEDGIKLFYKNDFYLARSLFSSILYECPTDSIARWYLFACDKNFHSQGTEFSYDLSEIIRTGEK